MKCVTSDKLDNCQELYQYAEEDKTYTVTAAYCNVVQEDDFCCTSLTRPIVVSN